MTAIIVLSSMGFIVLVGIVLEIRMIRRIARREDVVPFQTPPEGKDGEGI